MPPEALPTCFKPQATVVSASLISPASTPSCLSAASSIDNLTGPLTDLAVGGASNAGDGAAGAERKEGEGRCTPGNPCLYTLADQLLFPFYY
jgi:tankyrase